MPALIGPGGTPCVVADLGIPRVVPVDARRRGFADEAAVLRVRKAAVLAILGDGSRTQEFIPRGGEGVRSSVVSRDPYSGNWRVTNFTPAGPTGHGEDSSLDGVAGDLMSAGHVTGAEGQVNAWARARGVDDAPATGQAVEVGC